MNLSLMLEILNHGVALYSPSLYVWSGGRLSQGGVNVSLTDASTQGLKRIEEVVADEAAMSRLEDFINRAWSEDSAYCEIGPNGYKKFDASSMTSETVDVLETGSLTDLVFIAMEDHFMNWSQLAGEKPC